METSLARARTNASSPRLPMSCWTGRWPPVRFRPSRLGTLTGLFYEARFSTHPMPPAKRDQAQRALADLADHLPIGQPR